MTRAGFEYILDKHVCSARKSCPSLNSRSVSPHQLRHSCALMILKATRDIRKVALWLGHADIRTTEIYLRVDPSEKLEAVEAVVPLGLRRGRFKAPDALIASLSLKCGPHRYFSVVALHNRALRIIRVLRRVAIRHVRTRDLTGTGSGRTGPCPAERQTVGSAGNGGPTYCGNSETTSRWSQQVRDRPPARGRPHFSTPNPGRFLPKIG
jgi:hypothetical protein